MCAASAAAAAAAHLRKRLHVSVSAAHERAGPPSGPAGTPEKNRAIVCVDGDTLTFPHT